MKENNLFLKVLLGIVLILVLLSTAGFFGTLAIAIVAFTVMRLIEVKTFIKWLLIGVVCAILGATPLFFICVIVGGVLYGKEQFAKIDEEFDKRDRNK